MKIALILVIATAIFLRVLIFLTNPVNNSFDDHLSNVQVYYESGASPAIASGWQSYQPPVYYQFGASILRLTSFVGFEPSTSWKLVQFISCISSITAFLAIVILVKSLFRLENHMSILGLALYAIYPRDLYISGFATNDSLLCAFGAISILAYVKYNLGSNELRWCLVCCVSATLASWTKQSGLVFLILPTFIAFALMRHEIIGQRRELSSNAKSIILLLCLLSALISLLDEFNRFQETGIFLASNQHFYPEVTASQLPGKLDEVEFFKFPIAALFHNPFLSKETLYSFPVEIFARHWFDYEPRYLTPKIETLFFARMFFIVGFLSLVIIILGVYESLKKRKDRLMFTCLLFVFLAFLAVPLVQTVRLPYYSSMKATFSLPAMSIAVVYFILGIKFVDRIFCIHKKLLYISSLVLLLLGVAHIILISSQLPDSIQQTDRPQWKIPIF